MKKYFFINDKYEVLDESSINHIDVLFQGSSDDCDDYIINHFRELISDAIGCSIHNIEIKIYY